MCLELHTQTSTNYAHFKSGVELSQAQQFSKEQMYKEHKFGFTITHLKIKKILPKHFPVNRKYPSKNPTNIGSRILEQKNLNLRRLANPDIQVVGTSWRPEKCNSNPNYQFSKQVL